MLCGLSFVVLIRQLFILIQVPVPFLVMLLAQFLLMLIDRAIYLRKQVFGKFIFQILLVLVVHIWLFFILPYITNR